MRVVLAYYLAHAAADSYSEPSPTSFVLLSKAAHKQATQNWNLWSARCSRGATALICRQPYVSRPATQARQSLHPSVTDSEAYNRNALQPL
jgi:hypothetical protein